MKKLSAYMFLLVTLVSWSCEEDSNMAELGNWEITAPTLSTPSSDANIVLDESAPDAPINFQWGAAVTSNRFVVGYKFVLVPETASDLSNPAMEVVPSANGKDRFVNLTAEQLDYALWTKCYEPGASVKLKWVVVAKAIEKEAQSSNAITITRFSTDPVLESLVITGAGTEAGPDPANATSMRARTDSDGEVTGVFDVYTTLNKDQTFVFRDQASAGSKLFGGGDGSIEPCGTAIVAPESGQYRVTANLNDETYNLWKVDKWSLVGDAVPGGWGGDVPLTYIGNGVWQAQVEFLYPYDGAGFIFRANGDWGYIMKQVKGTVAPTGMSGSVIMESEAGNAGVEVEDSRIGKTGIHTVTLDLSNYTFSIVAAPVEPGDNQTVIGKTNYPDSDGVTGNFDIGDFDAPDQLFLISDGLVVAELTKDGDVFTSAYLALEKNKTYILSDAEDGSGTTYNSSGDGSMAVARDQAYKLTVNFAEGKLFWKYYNMKLFHWDEVGGGWDQRQELVMTYTHPYKFEVTGTLSAGFHSKFNSPWDVQFGTADTALSGTMTNGGPNYTGITQNGTYKATIVVNDEFSEATYTFVKQ